MTKKPQEQISPDLIKNPISQEVIQSTVESSSQRLSIGLRETLGILTGLSVLGYSVIGAINNPRKAITSVEENTVESILPATAQEEITKAKLQRQNKILIAQKLKEIAIDSGKDVIRVTEHDHVYSNAQKEFKLAVQTANEDFLKNVAKVETDYIVEIEADFPSDGPVKLSVKKQY